MNTQTYTKGQAIRVNGKSGYTYIEPCNCGKCDLHILQSESGRRVVYLVDSLTPEPAPAIDLGEGYRLLEVGEEIQRGDEFFHNGVWAETNIHPSARALINPNDIPYRRRVPVETPRGDSLEQVVLDAYVLAEGKYAMPMTQATAKAIASAVRTAVPSEQVNPVYVTAERKPTKEDADEFGVVFALTEKIWGRVSIIEIAEHPERYSHWTPMPKIPVIPGVSEEEKARRAFKEWANKTLWHESMHGQLEVAWKAALKYAKSAK